MLRTKFYKRLVDLYSQECTWSTSTFQIKCLSVGYLANIVFSVAPVRPALLRCSKTNDAEKFNIIKHSLEFSAVAQR